MKRQITVSGSLVTAVLLTCLDLAVKVFIELLVVLGIDDSILTHLPISVKFFNISLVCYVWCGDSVANLPKDGTS